MHASRLVGSDTLYEFNRGQLEVSRYYPLGRRGAFAWRALAGTILPARRIALAGKSVHFIPPDQRFYGGGPNSVRGYARNELGPRVYVTDSIEVQGKDTIYRPDVSVRAAPDRGHSVVVMNADLRFATPLFPDRMRVALFVDAGQVWQRGGDPGTGAGGRVTPGGGLRFATPPGPGRPDAALDGNPAEPGPPYFPGKKTQTLTPTNRPYQPRLP